MKHKLLKLGASITVATLLLTGCQSIARNYGGSAKIELEPGEKLEMITWKGDDLWYLTRPMRDDETAETHVFKQSKDLGFEGEVVIIESESE